MTSRTRVYGVRSVPISFENQEWVWDEIKQSQLWRHCMVPPHIVITTTCSVASGDNVGIITVENPWKVSVSFTTTTPLTRCSPVIAVPMNNHNRHPQLASKGGVHGVFLVSSKSDLPPALVRAVLYGTLYAEETNLTNPTTHLTHIPQSTIQTEMCTFLFRMVDCWIRDWCIVGLVKLVYSWIKNNNCNFTLFEQ